jgi:2'-5' RNA ligase
MATPDAGRQGSGRWVVVLPLEPLRAGDVFSVGQWPLHVTLVEPFTTAIDADALGAALEPLAASTAPVPVTIGPDALFGPKHDIPVSLVEDGGRLAPLRADAQDALRALAVDLRHPRTDYRPHVTAKRHGRVREGDRLTLELLTLVRLRPPETSHHGRIAGSWSLSGRAGSAP